MVRGALKAVLRAKRIMPIAMDSQQRSPLGRDTGYPDRYDPRLLFAIDRAGQRTALGFPARLPFGGADRWTAYEICWLDDSGRPQLSIGELTIAADSPATVESKSLKLYLGSFAQERLASRQALASTIGRDLSRVCRAPLEVRLRPATAPPEVAELPGDSLDGEDVVADATRPDPGSLAADGAQTAESLRTALFRSTCPVTGQPDYGDLMVSYRGRRIDRAGLLRYLLSYRTHAAFHETCVERIFIDIGARCRPQCLTVYARFVRRGGIDINPFRSDFEPVPAVWTRTPRQ